MNQDPYITTAGRASICPETGKQIIRGDEIAYYPRERRAFHINSKAADQVRALNFASAYGMADANW